MKRTVVAGIGNVFLGDDGFGVAVAQRLASEPLPESVRVIDAGIRGVHLAYDLMEGVDRAILVDAWRSGQPPGTITVLEPEIDPSRGTGVDAHVMDPSTVLATLATLGGGPAEVLLVACEPLTTEEGMGLSGPVAAAVEPAARLVSELVS